MSYASDHVFGFPVDRAEIKLNREIKDKENYYVIVSGSRDFNDYELLTNKLDFYLSEKSKTHNIVIISGTCKGADKLGEIYALENNYKVWRFPTDWSLGKKAGPTKNEEMAKNANACIYFYDGQSKGIVSMISLAKKYNLSLKVVKYS